MMGLLQTAVYRFVTYLSCLLYLFYFVPFLLFWALPLKSYRCFHGWIYVTVANFMGFFYIAKVVEYHASENFMSWTSILPTLTFSSALYYIGKADDAGLAVSLSGATGICKAPMPCCRVMIFLAVEWAIFLLLGIYIDVAVTSQGYQKYALIFLDCPMYMRTIKRYFWCKLEILKHLCFSRSCDIRMETGMDFSLYTLDMELQLFSSIEIDQRDLFSIQRKHLALDGLTVGVPLDSCLGILGKNGAGKTITITIFSGLFPPIGGQEEHLQFYALLKSIKRSELKHQVDCLLESTDLIASGKTLVRNFNGGTFAGDPDIVFLDEPRTGLDSLSKQALWR
ncbi:hypothetical protein Gasu2_27800 [Galdieria sulphuraria]|nr:hypothetical protein Gasu2_27800 [Galdieria sulphuraria]